MGTVPGRVVLRKDGTRALNTDAGASSLPDDLHQNSLRPTAVKLAVEDLLPGAEVEVEVAEPTPIGWLCIKLRKEEIPGNMLAETSNLNIDPTIL